MLEDNKQCQNCGFDTIAIVTVDTSNWDYCPVCGSGFVSVKDDMEGNVDEDEGKLQEVPIGEESTGEESTDDGSEDSQTIEINSDKSSDTENMSDADIEEELDDSDFVDEELSRLKKFMDNEDDN